MNKFILALLLCSFTLPSWSAETKLERVHVDTSPQGIQQGMENLMDNCHSCHSLKYIRYLDLLKLGVDKKKVDELRGDQAMEAPLTSQMPDDSSMASFGKIPPDLSLMVKAREGGPDYVYSYLIGYYNKPDGSPSNHIFPETKMPDVLGISFTEDAAQRTELQAKARSIVSFLAWASDPHAQERQRLGYYVLGYLFVLTFLLYLVKSQIWSRLK